MDPIQRLLAIEDVKQLKARYCYCVAHEDWKGFFELFTPDLQFITPDGDAKNGRDAFYAYHRENLQLTKLWGVVHCYTPIITITGPDTAEGIWNMSDVHVWPGDKKAPRVGHVGFGHYYEDYVRTKDGWKFKRIKVTYERFDPLEGGFGEGMME